MYKVYQVMSGDTVESIASKFNVSVDELLSLNGVSKNDIVPGTLLVVPTTNNNFTNYVIEKGDTLYTISSKYNVPVDMIVLLNGLNKNDYIYPGETIILPKEGIGVYFTNEGDSLKDIVRYSNLNDIVTLNDKIYLRPNQVILYTKSK